MPGFCTAEIPMCCFPRTLDLPLCEEPGGRLCFNLNSNATLKASAMQAHGRHGFKRQEKRCQSCDGAKVPVSIFQAEVGKLPLPKVIGVIGHLRPSIAIKTTSTVLQDVKRTLEGSQDDPEPRKRLKVTAETGTPPIRYGLSSCKLPCFPANFARK